MLATIRHLGDGEVPQATLAVVGDEELPPSRLAELIDGCWPGAGSPVVQ